MKNTITANNQEIRSWPHSLTAKTHVDTFTKTSFLPYLCFDSQVPAKIEGKIQNFDVSLYLYHFYGTICAVKTKELIRNFSY